MTSAPLLKIDQLHAGYGEVGVLWGVDLALGSGDLACLVGSNGAGKSTLMRCCSGLLTPAGGRIRFDGRDVTRATPPFVLSTGIAHVPEGRRLFGAMSVADNLAMGAYLRGDPAAVARDLDRVYAIFPVLARRRRQHAGTLSGGEQQMCAIGRGMMSAPRLLMIDELSLGLAPQVVDELAEVLRAINREGTTILVVEQDVTVAFELAAYGFVMESGRIVQHGPSVDLARDPAVRKAYLGTL